MCVCFLLLLLFFFKVQLSLLFLPWFSCKDKGRVRGRNSTISTFSVFLKNKNGVCSYFPRFFALTLCWLACLQRRMHKMFRFSGDPIYLLYPIWIEVICFCFCLLACFFLYKREGGKRSWNKNETKNEFLFFVERDLEPCFHQKPIILFFCLFS